MKNGKSEMNHYDIKNHGIIGDTFSSALINTAGTIDWCSFPRFDSDPFFYSLLDTERGGEFSFTAVDALSHHQHYRKNTNVLVTTIRTEKGVIEITDFMPVEFIDHTVYSRHEIRRLIRCRGGHVGISMIFRPRFAFGRSRPILKQVGTSIVASSEEEIAEKLELKSTLPFSIADDRALCGVELSPSCVHAMVLRWGDDTRKSSGVCETEFLLKKTVSFWRHWVEGSGYSGRWREEVIRSALALKALQYSPTGAICAAATTSLPEAIGGERNWDYRYSWIRDSTYALLSFNSLGHKEEERRYFLWLSHLLRGDYLNPSRLKVMYTIEGDRVPDEILLSYIPGYHLSVPVRVGNGATDQLQFDIYGSLVNALYFTFRPPSVLPDQIWRIVKSVADFISENWEKEDMGIWEVRNGKRRHTHSAVMSWLALRRASEMAGWLGYVNCSETWSEVAQKIRRTIEKGAVNGYYSSTIDGQGHTDASLLIMPIVGFTRVNSSRFKNTLRRIERELVRSGYVYRYRVDDGLKGDEGAFLLCTFWYIICLAMSGKLRKAQHLMDRVVSDSNQLGLFSEEIDPSNGEFLGNFPQAFTHMGMIQAALILDSLENGSSSHHSRRHSTRHTTG